ncbi:MAG: hypothetical protein ACXABO_10395 [Promethearchaeota archaeon]|jgi:hypothetical protein
MILSTIIIIISVVISLVGIVYIILKRENYGTILNSILNILLYLFLGIVFLPLFTLSTDIFLNKNIALLFWKISIFFWTISLSILSLIQVAVIKSRSLTPSPSIFYALIIGLVTSLTFITNSIEIIQGNDNNYLFVFKNFTLLSILVFYNIITIFIMWFNLIINFPKFRDKQNGRSLGFLTLHFSLLIIIYTLHLLFQNIVLRYLYVILYLIGAFIASYTVFKQPFLFIELTNRIYDFIIFHRSGILLYSYNFETGKETDDSLLKGSILIGISHILSSFFYKKEQLNLIKMRERDIVFEYDITHGYAILLITNHKNTFIEKAVRNFMQKFSDSNGEKFKNVKGLIDVSEFQNARELLIENFEPYIVKL